MIIPGSITADVTVDTMAFFAGVRVHHLIDSICAFEQERSREDWEHLRRSIGQKLRRIREAHEVKPRGVRLSFDSGPHKVTLYNVVFD